ncbi:hypothetical protein JL722_13293 [Aureococcus anophagefferens]|nr:hypothetical protein JL722_13293 [Aureococcus anophagefferens]
MTPQEALEQVAPRGRAAPKLKNALREDAYEVFEAWASQSAAAAAEDLAAATARSNDAGREAAAIKAAMDKKKKKKSMAEADYAPVAAGAAGLNRRAAETVAEIRAAAAAALRPQVESWEDAFAKTVVRRDGAVVGGDRAAEARGAAAKVSFERPLPDAADAAEPPPPPPPDDGYDRHAAAYDALLERLKELSDAAAKKKDGAADAAQPAEAEAPPPAKGAGWGAPGFELQHAMDYALAAPRRGAAAAPATADVAPPPPPDAA